MNSASSSDHRPIALGLDFGTESVRAVLIDSQGQQHAEAVAGYAHGQVTDCLPGSDEQLPDGFAFQWPADWLDSMQQAVQSALESSQIVRDQIVGIGVDFTSCTMLPTLRDGTPLCQLDELRDVPMSWAKLWKHHGAVEQTERINRLATERGDSFLSRYGGTIGLEWFFPKLLETLEVAPNVAKAADVWLEAGDWLVWQLVGCDADQLTRSTCQAGYKALWSSDEGYASPDFFNALHPELNDIVANKMPGVMRSPGESAGQLCPAMAERLGLPAGISVSTATIDAHSAVPGVGAAKPGTLVMVMGTSSCHMLNSVTMQPVDGVAGIVDGGILPGFFGYETGQAAVGDAFAWLLKLLNLSSFDQLSQDAMALPPGSGGVRCLDWMNGCRTPLMDGALTGMFHGLTLGTTPAHLYRSLLEASAFGLRWIVELFTQADIPVERLVATGGLPHHNPALVQVYADVLGHPIEIHPSTQGPAVGAAVLGMVAAGPQASGFADIEAAATAMAAVPTGQETIVQPNPAHRAAYDQCYQEYRQLADLSRQLPSSKSSD
jgi:L-ribulokinase